jgi:glycine/D-amino acid oxidase-like deaminating enzyme
MLVVGAGLVGLTAAILLGARGWRVGVVERWPQPYPLPRAVILHHDAARILAAAGLAEVLPTLSGPGQDCQWWRNGQRETRIRTPFDDTSYSGWPVASLFTQPRLQAALEQRARSIAWVRHPARLGSRRPRRGRACRPPDGRRKRGATAGAPRRGKEAPRPEGGVSHWLRRRQQLRPFPHECADDRAWLP